MTAVFAIKDAESTSDLQWIRKQRCEMCTQ